MAIANAGKTSLHTSLICKKSLTPKEMAEPWTGESSSRDPSYATFVRTANATGLVWKKWDRNRYYTLSKVHCIQFTKFWYAN